MKAGFTRFYVALVVCSSHHHHVLLDVNPQLSNLKVGVLKDFCISTLTLTLKSRRCQGKVVLCIGLENNDDAEPAYTDEVYKYLDRTCPHLLGSNDPPSEIEARDIVSFIHDAQSELEEADNEILSLQTAMKLAKE